ncbi:3-methyl-2-oxobutanoate hydroxymethyltransferase [Aquimarina aquimarini]|uniref:3-methyl-2-oxobutanoate hydroxymethyltransferase n=1 Tax=Aquimarina aquimarini TaxID=1191734 RepID=UPI000D560319|nr:3-methyl-2-oxobutanoate hydroxymethyltransferase [Aquimarina aquimarini]
MYKVSLIVMLLFWGSVFSQKSVATEDVSRYKKEVKHTILGFFEGFHSGDTAKIKMTIDANIALQTIVKTKEGKVKAIQVDIAKVLTTIHNRPKEQKWDERLLGFKIEADASIANAWTPYEFYINDTFSHCGVNMFQLFNDGTTWRILAITDTRHKNKCK